MMSLASRAWLGETRETLPSCTTLSNCVAATIEDRNKAELKFDVSPLMQIEGNYEKVIGMLQKRYGGNCARLVQDRYGGESRNSYHGVTA
jgi:hypothetical protein